MNYATNRRRFLKTTALAGAAISLPNSLALPSSKSLLVFTKSSGFEHQVVKRTNGSLSICETVATEIGKKNGFHVECSKDGRIFDSPEFHSFAAALFFTTGDLTEEGTDKNPPMSPAGKQKFLDTIHEGMGFVGVHAASDTFHTQPDTKDLSSRYVAYGEKRFRARSPRHSHHRHQQTQRRVLPAPPVSRHLGPHAWQGSCLFHRHRRSSGKLAESILPEFTRRRHSLVPRRSQRRHPHQHQGRHSRLCRHPPAKPEKIIRLPSSRMFVGCVASRFVFDFCRGRVNCPKTEVTSGAA